MEKKINIISPILILFTLTGCPPYSETKLPVKPTATSDVESLLLKTSTGSNSVAYLNQLRAEGFSVKLQPSSTSETKSINGHNGGGFKRNGSEIIVFINSSLSEADQAHVLAHELVYIVDDFEIDQFLVNRPNLNIAAADIQKSLA